MSADHPGLIGFPGQAAAEFVPGARVAGYLIEEQLGMGGMAVVFRARDERLDRQIALKVMAPALASDEEFRTRFIGESRRAAAVEDPHIIPVHEAGEAGGTLFIAMRYVPGGDLRSLVRRDGPLAPARAAAIIYSVASALDAAHAAGLVHRDVKPANMLLDVRPGRPDHVYLSDFGLSKHAFTSLALTRSGQFVGTLEYSSPEHIDGRDVDGRADQYSLACAAFELLTGAPPFTRDQATALIWAHMSVDPPSLTSRRPGLPLAADAVMARALAKASADRYDSCREFADALGGAFGLAPHDSGPGLARSGHSPITRIAGSDGSAEITSASGKTRLLPESQIVTRFADDVSAPSAEQDAESGAAAIAPEPAAVRKGAAFTGLGVAVLAGAAGLVSNVLMMSDLRPVPSAADTPVVLYAQLLYAVPIAVAVAALLLGKHRLMLLALLQGLWWPAVSWLAWDLPAGLVDQQFGSPDRSHAAYLVATGSAMLGVTAAVLLLISLNPSRAGAPRRGFKVRAIPVIQVCCVVLGQIAVLVLLVTAPDYSAHIANYGEGAAGIIAGLAVAWYAVRLRERWLGDALLLGWVVTMALELADFMGNWSLSAGGGGRALSFGACGLLGVAGVLAIRDLRRR